MASAFDESEIRSPTRLSALGRAALLDTDPEPYFDRSTRRAARLLTSTTTLSASAVAEAVDEAGYDLVGGGQ